MISVWPPISTVPPADHGLLGGLTDVADHPSYLTLDGARAMTGGLDMTGSLPVKLRSGGNDVQVISETGSTFSIKLTTSLLKALSLTQAEMVLGVQPATGDVADYVLRRAHAVSAGHGGDFIFEASEKSGGLKNAGDFLFKTKTNASGDSSFIIKNSGLASLLTSRWTGTRHDLDLKSDTVVSGIAGLDELTTKGQFMVATGADAWSATMLSGTTFPGSPFDGQRFYRTDLDWDFIYDGGRAKWLGAGPAETRLFGNNVVMAASAYLRTVSSVSGNGATGGGPIIPYDCTIVGFQLSGWTSTTNTGTYTVRQGSTIVSTIAVTAASGVIDMTLNDDFPANAFLNVFYTHTSGQLTRPVGTVFLRRRAT